MGKREYKKFTTVKLQKGYQMLGEGAGIWYPQAVELKDFSIPSLCTSRYLDGVSEMFPVDLPHLLAAKAVQLLGCHWLTLRSGAEPPHPRRRQMCRLKINAPLSSINIKLFVTGKPVGFGENHAA